MQVIRCEQGSQEWHEARAGVITASRFTEARARLKSGPSKGDFTKAGHDYAFALAVERISGQPLDEGGFEPWEARRGHELEPEARSLHEFEAGVTVERAGFVVSDCGRFGASADGLIGEDGGAEYKCFISPAKVREIVLSRDVSPYLDQVQGGLWITERAWWDFCLYCPALAPVGRGLTWFRVERDEAYIADLVADLRVFDELVESYRAELGGVAVANAVPEPEPSPAARLAELF